MLFYQRKGQQTQIEEIERKKIFSKIFPYKTEPFNTFDTKLLKNSSGENL